MVCLVLLVDWTFSFGLEVLACSLVLTRLAPPRGKLHIPHYKQATHHV